MRKIVTLVNIIMLTTIAGLAVDIFYGLLDARLQQPFASDTQENPPGKVQQKTQLALVPVSYYQPIIQRDLFGIGGTGKVLAPEPEPAEDLEQTRLNIRLWGTVTGKGTARYAVIEARTDSRRMEQALYQEGDSVDTATIEKILDDKVILKVDSDRQVLMLEKFEQKGKRSSYRRASRDRTPRVRHRTISHKMIENASKNFNQLLTQAKVIPVRNGMKITRIKSGSLFRRLGLRNGDVITSVNDRQIKSVDDAMSMYQNLQKGSNISIELRRRNRAETIEYRIR